MKHALLTLSASALLAPATLALGGTSFHLNEIYASHSGTDIEEFIEVFGTPSASLAGIMVLEVEGEDPVFGILDRAWDLSSFSMPADGYFVLGDTAVANVDLNIGTQDSIENGTETFYLISTTDTAAINAMLGTNVDSNGDLITDIATHASVTILDIVAMIGSGTTDRTYDNAPVLGPDGTFFPAGIYRGNDYPTGWCSNFLLFNPGVDRTPGTQNVACIGGEPGTKYCFGIGCPCVDDANGGCQNSTGLGSVLAGSGTNSVAADDLVLTAINVPANKPGLFFMGPNQIDLPFGDGKRCVGGQIFRYTPPINSGATGTMTMGPGIVLRSLSFDISGHIDSGETWNFQAWFRDTASTCGAFFNLSNGYSVTFGN